MPFYRGPRGDKSTTRSLTLAALLPTSVAYAGCSSSSSGGATTVTCTDPPIDNATSVIIGGPSINTPPNNPQNPSSYALPSNYNVTVSTNLSTVGTAVITLMSNNVIVHQFRFHRSKFRHRQFDCWRWIWHRAQYHWPWGRQHLDRRKRRNSCRPRTKP